ncbi:hypothetical protein [Portibacter lacus]|uniref:hypothetical protein n=1 Tax=Portibacter lacus TaxID=1099794 RepID=UPI001F302B0F|nr:hypothetical protein [Portibacter lacus]
MNTKNRIRTVLFLTAIYCYAIGIVANSQFNNNFKENLNHESGSYFSLVSSGLFVHNSSSENSLSSLKSFSKPSINNPNGFNLIENNRSEQSYEIEYLRNHHHSISYLLNNRKAEIIYPFHFFW